ncbi:MAG TPA: hypothetical protein DIW20_06880 [Rhodospirillaceae bacterium]|nr:hypothetical protein [Rhodospirillaceae bacterium]
MSLNQNTPAKKDMAKKDMEGLVGQTLRDTFSGMFGWQLENAAAEHAAIPAPVRGATVLRENIPAPHALPLNVEVIIDFDPQLLSLAGAHIYPDDMKNTAAMYTDMAGEIANILAGSLKTYINRLGYALALAMPLDTRARAVAPFFLDTAFAYNNGANPKPLGLVVHIAVNDAHKDTTV